MQSAVLPRAALLLSDVGSLSFDGEARGHAFRKPRLDLGECPGLTAFGGGVANLEGFGKQAELFEPLPCGLGQARNLLALRLKY